MKFTLFRLGRIFLIILSLTFINEAQSQEKILNQKRIDVSKHKAIVDDLLNGFNTGASASIKLFHEDAIIEYPYAYSLGTPSKLNKKEYETYLENALSNMPNMEFTNVKVYTVNKNIFWAEFHGEFTVPTTKKRFKSDYVVRIILKKGKILNLKEYWNPLAASAFSEEKDVKNIFKKDK
ncbi:nuclear transport factor 2 family protein [Wenyingzhuangia sp. 2_MG-2023]|uniref:nuclear transport factor 2 family protein n=1 Tax=Wenyingzhuangia sp. 2_MG-2023 TaxID=3062639 RepID=UPI0026E428BF|nr:nuclear transport factor 2 family protein [Wenyingzhuangia sp. 2_MG-2023]MDO6739345.1 nuclear transport factor 2 family protein [Wenyingzhuangia sp. 2_MG-2023]MDO6801940.1 nuclear transport factor 2 family protein [Wenyingzhuangia sp. 1_MG-2023]